MLGIFIKHPPQNGIELGNLQSKTILGLVLLLAVAVIMSLCGKLTPEFVDVLKWVGGSFMAVRIVANHAENKYGNSSGS